jgi:dihydrofolate reductase
MRRVRYVIAASLDGYIAGPNGELDWIVSDPDTDFRALYDQFDAVLLGRRTYELTLKPGAPPWPPGMHLFVFSRTLRQRDHPTVTVVAGNLKETLAALADMPGKDIWLFGGSTLFRSLLGAGLVDALEIAVSPVLLGAGIPLLPPPVERTTLTLTGHEAHKTGVVSLRYDVGKKNHDHGTVSR